MKRMQRILQSCWGIRMQIITVEDSAGVLKANLFNFVLVQV